MVYGVNQMWCMRMFGSTTKTNLLSPYMSIYICIYVCCHVYMCVGVYVCKYVYMCVSKYG